MLTARVVLCLAMMTLVGLPSCRYLAAQEQTAAVASGAYAELDDATARKLARGCSIPHEVSGPGASGSQVIVQFSVSEKGELLSVHRVQGAFTHQLSAAFASCRFASYKVNGVATPFHANILIHVK